MQSFTTHHYLKIVAAIPDGDATVPAALSDKLGTAIGYAKGMAYVILALLVIAAAVDMAASRQRGDSAMESGGRFVKLLVAVVVVGASVSLVELFA